jgi:hypothetical protein
MSEDRTSDIVEFPNGYKVDKRKFLSKRDRVLLAYKEDGKAPTSYTDSLAIQLVFGENPGVDTSRLTNSDGKPLSEPEKSMYAPQSDSEPKDGADDPESSQTQHEAT